MENECRVCVGDTVIDLKEASYGTVVDLDFEGVFPIVVKMASGDLTVCDIDGNTPSRARLFAMCGEKGEGTTHGFRCI